MTTLTVVIGNGFSSTAFHASPEFEIDDKDKMLYKVRIGINTIFLLASNVKVADLISANDGIA